MVKLDLDWTPPKQKRSRLSFLPFLLIILVAGLGYAIWHFGSEYGPISDDRSNANIPAVNNPNAEKPILYAAIEPANANQQSNGIRETFQNSKALNAANSRLEEIKQLTGEQSNKQVKKP